MSKSDLAEIHKLETRILLSPPDVTDLEEKYVVDAIRSGWIAPAGPDLNDFESEMAQRVGCAHSVALSSGTAGLHLALLAKGVGPGSVVPTSSMTFAATANAIAYTGAEPYFVDSDSTGNIDPELLAECLSDLTAAGERISAIVPVDLLGKVADYTRISRLAGDYGVPLIADAAESLGAKHAGRAAGAWGDAAVVSFNGNKIMTTSGGGMLYTDDENLAQHCRYLSTQARQPVAHYEHTDIGYNYRLSNILAALGRAQLSRLDDMIARRRNHRRLYKQLFQGMPGVSIFGGEDDENDNCWLTSITVDPEFSGWEAASLAAALASRNIESRPLWKPMHMQPVFASARAITNGTSERFFETGLTLPSGSALRDDQMRRISECIDEFLGARR